MDREKSRANCQRSGAGSQGQAKSQRIARGLRNSRCCKTNLHKDTTDTSFVFANLPFDAFQELRSELALKPMDVGCCLPHKLQRLVVFIVKWKLRAAAWEQKLFAIFFKAALYEELQLLDPSLSLVFSQTIGFEHGSCQCAKALQKAILKYCAYASPVEPVLVYLMHWVDHAAGLQVAKHVVGLVTVGANCLAVVNDHVYHIEHLFEIVVKVPHGHLFADRRARCNLFDFFLQYRSIDYRSLVNCFD